MNSSDRLVAARKAARLYESIRAIGWDEALREFDPEHYTPKSALTIGEVLVAIASADLAAKTKTNYKNALRWFAARSIGFRASKKTYGPKGSEQYRLKVAAVKLSDLKNETVQGIMDRHIKSETGDANAMRSARISVSSFLRNAKAALSVAEKNGIVLPAPRPFVGVKKPEGSTPPSYTSVLDATELIQNAKKELANDPDAYLTILLALGAGLRRGEISNLTWRRVDRQRGRVLVMATGGWTPKTADSEQPVHVSEGLLNELEPFRKGPDDFVTTPAAIDHAVVWLRKHGLDTDKPLHSLRKEFGSLVAEASDLFTASKALRHSSIAVTAAVYVESRKRVAPDIGAMLKLNPPVKA